MIAARRLCRYSYRISSFAMKRGGRCLEAQRCMEICGVEGLRFSFRFSNGMTKLLAYLACDRHSNYTVSVGMLAP